MVPETVGGVGTLGGDRAVGLVVGIVPSGFTGGGGDAGGD